MKGIEMEPPNGFYRFVALFGSLGESDLPFDEVIASIYQSINPRDRPGIIEFMRSILRPPVNTNLLKSIWDKTKAGVILQSGEDVYTFFSMVLPICERVQQQVDALRPADAKYPQDWF